MITINKDRTAYIPEADRHIGFENDNLVETRYFEISDTELSEFSFKLDIADTLDIIDLEKVMLDDGKYVLLWNISTAAIGKGGIIKAQIRAFDGTGEKIWHSQIMEFVADESVNAQKQIDDTPVLSEFEQLEIRASNAVASAETAASYAKTDAENAKKYADSAAESESNAKAYSESAGESAEYTEKAAAAFEAAYGSYEKQISDANAHFESTDNPHSVTAQQVGAYTKEETDKLLENAASAGDLYEMVPFGLTDFDYSLDYEDNDYNNFVGENYVSSPFPHVITVHCKGETLGFSATVNAYAYTGIYAKMKVNGEYVLDNSSGIVSFSTEPLYMSEDIVFELSSDSVSLYGMTRKVLKGYSSLYSSLGNVDKALDRIIALQDELIGGENV